MKRSKDDGEKSKVPLGYNIESKNHSVVIKKGGGGGGVIFSTRTPFEKLVSQIMMIENTSDIEKLHPTL